MDKYDNKTRSDIEKLLVNFGIEEKESIELSAILLDKYSIIRKDKTFKKIQKALNEDWLK